MRLPLVLFAATSGAAGLLLTACVDLAPGETGMFGNPSGASGTGIAQASGRSSAESFATGSSGGSIIAATTYIIAKHQASERQRHIAEKRARAACARMSAARQAAAPKRSASRASKPAVSAKKKLPRYIAVDTVKDEKTSPRAQKSVMIWDTQAEQVVGNNVYDLQAAPAVGSTARFETYSAEYVGSGI